MIGWISTGCAVLMGVTLCQAIQPASQRGRLWWSLAIGPLIGLSLSSCIMFLLMMIADGQPLWVLLADGLITTAGTLCIAMLRSNRIADAIREATTDIKSTSSTSLLALTCMSILLGMIAVECRNYHHVKPNGWWDAVMIWNVRAKFFVHGTHGLAHDFQVDPMGHGDYPLMLPLSLSRMWGIEGIEAPGDPLVLQWIMLVSLVLLVVVSITQRAGLMQGAIAAIIMLSWPAYGEQLSWQIADIPLSAFLLATCVSLSNAWNAREKDSILWWLLASGFYATSCAWMKNEGIAALAIAVVNATTIFWRKNILKEGAVSFLKGAGPVLVTLFLFKLLYAPTSDLLATRSVSITQLLIDPNRHELIWKFAGYILWQTACWPLCLLALLAVVGLANGKKCSISTLIIAIVFTMALSASYYVAYLTTPHDLDWHLGTSIHRLALHIWPIVVVGIANCCQQATADSITPKKDESETQTDPQRLPAETG